MRRGFVIGGRIAPTFFKHLGASAIAGAIFWATSLIAGSVGKLGPRRPGWILFAVPWYSCPSQEVQLARAVPNEER